MVDLDFGFLKTHSAIFESMNNDVLKVILGHVIRFAKAKPIFSREANELLNRNRPTRSGELMALLVSLLGDDATLRKYYESLDNLEKAFIEEIVHSNGLKIDRVQFQVKYGSSPKYAYQDRYYGRSQEDKFYPLCLLVNAEGETSVDLKKRLLGFVPRPRPVEGAFIDELPARKKMPDAGNKPGAPSYEPELVRHETETAALHDVKAVLRLAGVNKITVSSATGCIAKSSIEHVRKSLLAGDFYPEKTEAKDAYDVQMGEEGIRPFAWALLVQAGKLCKAEGTKLKLTAKGQEALSQPAYIVLKELWNKWQETSLIHEMNRLNVIKGQRSRSNPLRSAAICRSCIEMALSKLPVGKWLSVDEFEKQMIAHGHRFDVARNAWDLYLGDREYGSFGYDTHDIVLSRRYLWAFLLEYAATLGIIDVALILPWESGRKDIEGLWGADSYSCLSRYDGFEYLRLTPLGAWVLGLTTDYTVKTPEHKTLFKVTPNLEVNILSDKAGPAEELFLERICERVSDRVWKLSRQRILTVIEEGMEPDRIRDFLSVSGEAIPQTVDIFLKDILERTQKIKFAGVGSLMECSDESTALLMANDTQLKKLIVAASQRFLVVRQGDEKKFRNQLKKMGYVV